MGLAGRRFHTLRPGRLPYREALALQEALLETRPQGDADVLVLLEHPPVITCGRGAREEHLLLSPEELARRGIEVVRTGRGGDVTYHGPGQLIGYPIVDLDAVDRDLHRYLRQLEDVLIAVLATYDVRGERVTGKTGVWVEGEKIASIGVGVRRWVSWHGFALNLDDDLDGFSAIVPCGLTGVRMTSLERLLDRPVFRPEAEERIIHAFATIFDCDYAGNQTTCR